MDFEKKLFAFLEFLLRNRLDKSKVGEVSVVEALTHLEPLFDHCRNDKYAMQEDKPALFGGNPSINGFLRAVGDNPQGTDPFVTLSASRPKMEKPFWMDKEMWARFTGDRKMREAFWETVTGSLEIDFVEVLEKTYKAALESKLDSLLLLDLDNSISSCLEEKIWWSMDDACRELLYNRVMYGLFFYFGFILAGDRENVERLISLIQLIPKAVPLGKKPDGTWYVVYA